jgi:hypothetical protein
MAPDTPDATRAWVRQQSSALSEGTLYLEVPILDYRYDNVSIPVLRFLSSALPCS